MAERNLKDQYREEADALCDRIYITHGRYERREILRGEPLPDWYYRARSDVRELSHLCSTFWDLGTGRRLLNQETGSGNFNNVRLLHEDSRNMYEAVRDFQKAITPSWERYATPPLQMVEPVVLVDHRNVTDWRMLGATGIMVSRTRRVETETPAQRVTQYSDEGVPQGSYIVSNKKLPSLR